MTMGQLLTKMTDDAVTAKITAQRNYVTSLSHLAGLQCLKGATQQACKA